MSVGLSIDIIIILSIMVMQRTNYQTARQMDEWIDDAEKNIHQG